MNCETFEDLRLCNSLVDSIMMAGGTAEDCAVALAASNKRLIEQLAVLENIAPRRIRLPDGRVMLWRCPEHLVPVTDMSDVGQVGKERSDRTMQCTLCRVVKHVNDFDNCDVCTECANATTGKEYKDDESGN